jgi:hypothetical protein
MDEMDLLARMRDNAPRRVSPRAEQLFRASIYETRLPERTGLAPRLHALALHRMLASHGFWPARKRFLMAGGLAAAAAAAIVLPAVLPGSADGAFAAKAWAVERHDDGTVTLTLDQEFSDLHGLQAALRADGVPAIVSVIPWEITRSHGGIRAIQVCGYGSLDREPPSVEQAVITHPMVRVYVAYANPSFAIGVSKARAKPGMQSVEALDQSVSIIHPSAMPPGSVLFIEGSPSIASEGISGMVSDPLMVLRSDHLPACVPGHGGSSQWHSR